MVCTKYESQDRWWAAVDSNHPQEVDAVLAEAQRAGGIIVRPVARADWGGSTGAFADPDGYVCEVGHNPDWKLDDDGTVRI